MTARKLFEARIGREAEQGPLSAAFVMRLDAYLAAMRVRNDISAVEHGALRRLMREHASQEGLDAIGPASLAEDEARLAAEDAESEARQAAAAEEEDADDVPRWVTYP